MGVQRRNLDAGGKRHYDGLIASHRRASVPSRGRFPTRLLSGQPHNRSAQGPPSEALSTEDRLQALEVAFAAQQVKLAEVETLAKKKGAMQLFTQYGAPFAVWYAFMWAGSCFGIYLLLEL